MRVPSPPGSLLLLVLSLGLAYACAATPDPARVASEDPRLNGTGNASGGSGDDDTDPPADNGDVEDPFAADVTYFGTYEFGGTDEAHAAAGGADAGAPPAAANPDCLGCHVEGSARPTFVAGGLVYETYAGDAGTPCAQCDVMFVDSTGHRVQVKTSDDGTFALLELEYGTVAANTRVGVRKGPLATAMTGDFVEDPEALVLRGCNAASCHTSAAEGPIVLGTE